MNTLITPGSGNISFSNFVAAGSNYLPPLSASARIAYTKDGGLTIVSTASSSERFNVEGNFGNLLTVIDTSTGKLLVINDVSGFPLFFVTDNGTVSSASVVYASGGNSNDWNSVYTSVKANSANYILDGGNTKGSNISIGTNDAYHLNFETNNVTRATFLSSGQLGINKLAPTKTVDLSGNLQIEYAEGISPGVFVGGLFVRYPVTAPKDGRYNGFYGWNSTQNRYVSGTDPATQYYITSVGGWQLRDTSGNRLIASNSNNANTLVPPRFGWVNNKSWDTFDTPPTIQNTDYGVVINETLSCNAGYFNYIGNNNNFVIERLGLKNLTLTDNDGWRGGRTTLSNTLCVAPADATNYFDQPNIFFSDAGLFHATGPKASEEYRNMSFGSNLTTTNGADLAKFSTIGASPFIQLRSDPQPFFIPNPYGSRNGIAICNMESIPPSYNVSSMFVFIDTHDQASSSYGTIKIGSNIDSNIGVYVPITTARVQIDGNLNVNGLIRTTAAADSLYTGNSNNWNSVYTSAKANSANWDSVYTSAKANSSSWDSTYTSAKANSANWDSTYTSAKNNSANWDSVYTSAKNNSANWDSTYTSVKNNSATWDNVYTSAKANSASWDSTYTTTRDNSATWDESPNITDIATVSANWNSNYTSTKANSATWDSVYTSTKANSSSWDSTYTTTRDNSASWDESPNITDIAAVSANWNSNYTSTKNNSATWDSVYTSSSNNSANWVTYQHAHDNFLYLSGGYITGTLSVSGSLSGSGQFATSNMLLGPNENGAYFGRIGIRESSWQVVSGTEGVTWTARDSSRTWYAVAMSSDGRIQTAATYNGLLYTSTDYGVTWTARDSSRTWYAVAMSSDGRIQTAAVTSGLLYTSTDYGVTWTARDSVRNWQAVTMSSDGRIQTAATYNGLLYTSTDYGVTWTARDSVRDWRGVAMSSDGRIQTAAATSGLLYTSTDYGVTWTGRDSSRTWYAVAMSSDGRIQTAAANFALLYTSTDYGVTWTGRDSFRDWRGVAMSSDGRIQTATVYNGLLYTSTDYGITWTARASVRQWQAVAMSSDGRIQTAVVDGGLIYTSYATTYSPNPVTVNGLLSTNNVIYANELISSGNVGIITDQNNIADPGNGDNSLTIAFDRGAFIKKSLTVFGTVSTANTIYASGGDSNTWNSTTTTVRSISARVYNSTTPLNVYPGNYYLIDTYTGGDTVATLPANPTIGDNICFGDPMSRPDQSKLGWYLNKFTINRNSNMIEGLSEDLICDVGDISFCLTYIGGTIGWKIM